MFGLHSVLLDMRLHRTGFHAFWSRNLFLVGSITLDRNFLLGFNYFKGFRRGESCTSFDRIILTIFFLFLLYHRSTALLLVIFVSASTAGPVVKDQCQQVPIKHNFDPFKVNLV